MSTAASTAQPAHSANWHISKWQTSLSDCSDAAPMSEWLLAFFCPLCQAARAKSLMDQSSPCFNLVCFAPCASYSFIREAYNIEGDGTTDFVYGFFCCICSARQMFYEAKQKGCAPGKFGQRSHTWSSGLCGFGDMSEFFRSTFCPCFVTHGTRRTLQYRSEEKWFDYLCVFPPSLYGEARNTFGIAPDCIHSLCDDVLVACFCYPCAVARANREATYHKTLNATSAAAGIMLHDQAKVEQAGVNALKRLGVLGKRVEME